MQLLPSNLNATSQGAATSPLAQINPVVKFIAFSALTFAPIFFLDPYTPLAFLLLAWMAAWPIAHFPPWQLAWRLRPYLLLACGLGLFNALFYGGATSAPIVTLGPLHLTPEGIAFGASIALRLLCMITYTALYFATTEPSALVNSLSTHARLPYPLAFTLLATYRFLPILQQEMTQIRAAQRIRSPYARTSQWNIGARIREGMQNIGRLTIPLLAGGIRRAERLALAMDGRGFGAFPTRTHYRTPRLSAGDAIFLLATFTLTALILLTLSHFGLLNGWLVGMAEGLAGGQP